MGIDCYIPVLKIYETGRLTNILNITGDPLVNEKDALKYGYLEAKNLKNTNVWNGKEFITII